MFRKVLIANRGEIARRVIRTCRRLGVATVAVWSDADADAPHVRDADEAVRVGPAPAAESYLRMDAILDAALRTGAEAIHPGYGFLAENPDFAQACADKGVVFIGPRPETVRLMGDKAASKRHMEEAGVPVVPGHHGDVDAEEAREVASDLGFPVLVKAVAGGGGKGMRRVDAEADLEDAIAAVRREAQAAFGDPRLLVEKLVERPRHIEVQVFGDGRGGVVHLFERECSIQRRHQKIVEETPSPALNSELRERMCDAAVRAAESVDYLGAGTVEMLLSDATRDFYFLEMNTRLQVEHPVTEETTGVDLVEWQLRVAAGGPLPRSQDEITRNGHAVEVRLYAEDPANGFLPQTGTVHVLDIPPGPDVRVDSGVEEGSVVGPHYDPMLAKLVVSGQSRGAAIERLTDVLRRSAVLGVVTNLDHLRDVVAHPAFASGDLTTSFLDEHLPDWAPPAPDDDALAVAAAALAAPPRGSGGPWERLGPWRLAGAGGWQVRLRDGTGTEHRVAVFRDHRGLLVDHDGRTRRVRLEVSGASGRAVVDGEELPVHVVVDEDGAREVWVRVSGTTTRLVVVPETRHVEPGLAAAGASFVSPMPGSVAAVNVAVGDEVAAGTTLVVVEAMKMEHPVKAPVAARVRALHVAPGEAVDAGQALVELEAIGEEEDA